MATRATPFSSPPSRPSRALFVEKTWWRATVAKSSRSSCAASRFERGNRRGRLRELVVAQSVTHEGVVIKCTISIGAASLACTDDRSVDALVAVADRRLYLGKRSGRNKVVASG
jgi:GGDEF domain-containing protein